MARLTFNFALWKSCLQLWTVDPFGLKTGSPTSLQPLYTSLGTEAESSLLSIIQVPGSVFKMATFRLGVLVEESQQRSI